MKCPHCNAWSLVKETRSTTKGKRRRYECANLHRFSTLEAFENPDERIKGSFRENAPSSESLAMSYFTLCWLASHPGKSLTSVELERIFEVTHKGRTVKRLSTPISRGWIVSARVVQDGKVINQYGAGPSLYKAITGHHIKRRKHEQDDTRDSEGSDPETP